MRAVVIQFFGEPDVLQVIDVLRPEPGPGQVSIKLAAAAVHPFDLAVRLGDYATMLPPQAQYQLGWDIAGTVESVGEGVTCLRRGQPVVGFSDWFSSQAGTQAECVVLDLASVAAAPASADLIGLGGLPLNGLAAWQALDLLGLRPGQSLVVIGAAGGLGGYAAQLGVLRGLRVLGVAGSRDAGFVTSIGAAFLPRSCDLGRSTRALLPGGADAVLDAALVGPPALAAVRDGGSLVSFFRPAAPESRRGIKVSVVTVRGDAGQLTELVSMAGKGELMLRVAATFPLDEVSKAHAQLAKGGTRGQLLLLP